MILDEVVPRYSALDTAIGPAWFAFGAGGVCMLECNVDERTFLDRAERVLGIRPVRKDPPASTLDRLRRCIAKGDGSFVDWSRIGPFQRAVLEATAKIPSGQVRSYGQVADAIGNPRAVRAVGTALARNPVPLLVPCHRVIRSDGSLGNYGMGGDAAKRALLAAEGMVEEKALSRTS